LRILPTYWLYDAATRTLFTSDAFGYCFVSAPDGSRLTTEDDPLPSVDDVRTFTQAKHWWLPGAKVAPVVADLEARFERFDVHRIAPGHGQVIEGQDAVRAHCRLIVEALI
jgi:flavorubredoxin